MSDNSEMIIAHPKEHLSLKKRELDSALNAIILTDDEADEIRNKRAIKVLHDNVLGKIPGYKLARCLLTWNAEADREIKNAKKELLLVNCHEKLIGQGQSIQAITNFITNPVGSTLFNKLIQIIDDNPPDQELLQHLSACLKNMCTSDFEALFSDHKYALSQIEIMTPHSLTILSDSASWPIFDPGSFQSNGPTITSDWLEAFCSHYIAAKGISPDRRKFIRHCISELMSKRMIIATLHQERKAKAGLTEIGSTIVKYIEG
jgi:hypothetical protein